MGAFVASFIQYAIKFIVLGLVAYGGIICGKKFRASKDAEKKTRA